MVRKLFISQPMRGKIDDEFQDERNKAIAWYKDVHMRDDGEDTLEVIDNLLNLPAEEAWATYDYLTRSINLMQHATEAVFIGDYENYEGCCVEHYVARNYAKIGCYYYRPFKYGTHLMGFPMALMMAKDEKQCIARMGWNGKNQFVYWTPDSTVEDIKLLRHPALRREFEASPDPKRVYIKGHFDLMQFSEEGVPITQVGWVPSQGDLQGNDWYVVKDGSK